MTNASAVGVTVEEHGGVRRIELDRPEKKNALTLAMYDALADAIASAHDDGVGAILLRSSSDAFCSGNDIVDFLQHPPAGVDAPPFRFLFALASTDVPIVAGVRGAAVGIGTTMLLHCDVVYAAPSARFRVPFIDLGLVPEAASSVLLARTIGRSRAAAAFYLGETIGADEAAAHGLIARVVDDEALDEVAASAAAAIAAKPREAARATKRLMTHDRETTLEAMRREGAVFAERLASDEARSALRAFFEKPGRPPKA
jgi:enoyl-CoA hydratase/carnithine racemase